MYVTEPQPNLESLIWKHALVNAIRHDGRAEIAVVISKVVGERPDLKPGIKSVIPQVRSIVEKVNHLSVEQQSGILGEKFPEALAELQHPRVEEKRLPPLANAEQGKVVVRLPPEPSGFMHIGHGMAGIINQTYALMYGGKVWLRFEDTNPKKVKPEYYQSFRDGYSWLGIKWDYEKNVSDDMPIFYAEGERLITSGQAYGCTCQLDEIKRKRFTGTPCACREKSVDANLSYWRKMLAGEFGEGDVVIRLKGDMMNQDPALRDPNLFRIVDHPHPVQGERYRVWPVYDFAVVVEDHICQVSHILRSMEFHVGLQSLLRNLLGFPDVTVIQFSRFNFAGTPVSKRLIRPLIDGGLISGWDDPRIPTVDGLRRRGILSEAIREFTLDVGYTRSEHEFDWNLIYAVNRKILDPVTKRYFFVPKPIRLEVDDAPRLRIGLQLHPDKDLGVRFVETGGVHYIPGDDVAAYEKGDVFRLMELYNVEVEDKAEDVVRGRYAGSELREGIPKIQWVTEDHVKVTIMIPGPIFIDGRFNEDSLRRVDGLAERACEDLKIGEVIQFSRFGFCRIDAPNAAIFTHK